MHMYSLYFGNYYDVLITKYVMSSLNMKCYSSGLSRAHRIAVLIFVCCVMQYAIVLTVVIIVELILVILFFSKAVGCFKSN